METTKYTRILAMAAALALGTGVATAQNSPTNSRGTDNTSTDQRQGERPNVTSNDNAGQRSGSGTNSDTPNSRALDNTSTEQRQGERPNMTSNDNAGQRSGGMTADSTGAMQGNQADRAMLAQLQQISQNPDTASDRLFVLMAAHSNLLEMRMSELVAQRTDDQNVKQLAQQIVQDHRKAQERLRPVAQELNVQIPSELGAEEQAKLDIKRQMPVAQLEKGYLAALKASHAKDITMFEDHQQLVQNDQLKQYISQTIPTLREHGNHIVQTAQAKGLKGDFTVARSQNNSGGEAITGERRE